MEERNPIVIDCKIDWIKKQKENEVWASLDNEVASYGVVTKRQEPGPNKLAECWGKCEKGKDAGPFEDKLHNIND